MTEVTIDRLTLHLSGVSEEEARRLARHIAERLGSAAFPGQSFDKPAMQSKITSREGASAAEISEVVVADLIRQLERTL
jgi:hypothetical protein